MLTQQSRLERVHVTPGEGAPDRKPLLSSGESLKLAPVWHVVSAFHAGEFSRDRVLEAVHSPIFPPLAGSSDSDFTYPQIQWINLCRTRRVSSRRTQKE